MRTSLAILVALAGCTPSHEPCDPFALGDDEIYLEELVVVAYTTDGTRYVVDLTEDGLRAFAEVDGRLVRRDVLGSGESSTADGEAVTVTFDDGGTERTIVAELPNVGADRAALCDMGDVEAFSVDDAVDLGCVELTTGDEQDIAGLPVVDLPPLQVVEYHARVDTGELVVVLRDEVDWDGSFRVFWGSSAEMVEVHDEAVRAKDGGTTEFSFDVDGVAMLLHFGVDGAADWLERDGARSDVERLEAAPEAVDDYAYLCDTN